MVVVDGELMMEDCHRVARILASEILYNRSEILELAEAEAVWILDLLNDSDEDDPSEVW